MVTVALLDFLKFGSSSGGNGAQAERAEGWGAVSLFHLKELNEDSHYRRSGIQARIISVFWCKGRAGDDNHIDS
jgi:hypothetical protein